MIGVDTNVLVRLLANDDPEQSAQAARLFATGDVFIPKTVMLETEWVLRFSYDLSRSTIAAAFERLLSAASVSVEAAGTIRAAVDGYVAGMDFADALHIASSAGADQFLTFDKKLGRLAARIDTTPGVRVI